MNILKKASIMAAALLISATSFGFQAGAAEQPPIDKNKLNLSLEVLVNARRVQFPDMKPIDQNGRILVPLRFVSDKLGGKLSLKGNDITIVKGDRTVKLTIGAKTATANGKTITLDVAANAIKGRTMVPLRFISEALGEKVEWDSLNQYVWIGNKNVPKIEDVLKADKLSNYAKYLSGSLNDDVTETVTGVKYSQIRIAKSSDFPLKIGDYIYYRIDKALDIKGNEYTRLVCTVSGSGLGDPLYLLRDKLPIRKRHELTSIRETQNGMMVQYHQIVDVADRDLYGAKDYDKLKIKDIDYVLLYTPLDFSVVFKPDFLQ